MKALYVLLSVLFFSATTWAQVDISATGGTPNASYPTLKAAFDQVNLGTHTGIISIGISGSTTETASAILNASGNGAASYVAITIQPTGGTARTISGDIAGPLIDLNGADSVTIDGLNTGGNSLTISNTNTGTTASTIRLIQDASNNVVNRCNVRGSTGASGTTGVGNGVIYFAYGNSPITANDNNTISNNTIGPAGSNLPLFGILSNGVIGTGLITHDNNRILNNSIFDYFNPYESSAGIYLTNANGPWTISGNSLYQTASRTPVNGRSHYGIGVVTGNGHTITNNFIGGSSPSALGTAYTIAGTASNRFTGIYVVAGNLTITNIQGNTIANMSLTTSDFTVTTSGVWCGINFFSGNANVGTTAPNIIGATSGTDNIRIVSSGANGLVVGIHSGSIDTIAIQNNNIGAISFTGLSAPVAGHVAGISNSGQAALLTISGNNIGNTTADNMRSGTNGVTTGASIVSGITIPTVPVGNVIMAGNTIRNLSAYGTGPGFVRGIWTAAAANATATFFITGNAISVLTTNATLSGIAFGRAAAVGINVATGNNNIISQNTVHTLSCTNTGTSGSYVAGITTAFATNATITRNRIYNMANAGTSTSTTSPSVASGIVVYSGTDSVTVSNNMVSLGNGQNTNTAFIGIQCVNSTTPDPLSRIYYNTVHIEGTVLTGAQPSFGIARVDFSIVARTAPVDIKNNIVNNTRSGGTGGHFAIGNNYGLTTASSIGWGSNASNYNLLNANAATVGVWGGTTRLSFTNWKSSSAGDGNSMSAKPVSFANTVTGNLRLNFGTTPTSIESAGIPIVGITNDFDNDTRPGPAGAVNGASFAPDLGADEFDGVYLDIVPPIISYTPLSFTCNTNDRTLIATITDFSGIPITGAGLPRLFWRKNTDPYTAVTGTNIGSNQYRFVFGGGTATGDIVSYYIVAQDNAATPNMSAFPLAGASGFTANPPNASTRPNSPSNYVINNVLPSGTYRIGTGGNYTSVATAINAYNNSCLVGPIVFEIGDGIFQESPGWTIIKHPDASATNTLTIRPAAGATPYIGGNVVGDASLRILGSYVTIDGSNNGSQSRNLTIGNTSTNAPIALLIGSTGNNPITNVTIKNCKISTSAFVNPAVVLSDGIAYNDSGYFNNINFINNQVYHAGIGLHINAVPIAGNGNGLIIADNLMNVSNFEALGNGGIYLQGVDGAIVSGNKIGNFESGSTENDFGISLYNTSNTILTGNTISNLTYTSGSTAAPTGIRVAGNIPVSGITITNNTITGLNSNGGTNGSNTYGIYIANTVSGVTISQNKISQIINSNINGWGAHGILLNSSSTTANTAVTNNFIADVASYGYAGTAVNANGYGITINNGAGYHIYHNTINLAANQTLASGLPAAVFVNAGVTTPGAINLRNNIFSNRQTGGSTERYAILCRANSNVFATIDNNDYYTNGPNLSNIASANQANLAALQTAFGGNANSLNLPPTFMSGTDLRLNTNENLGLDNKGLPIGTVTIDIDSVARSTVTPDMGASEFAFLGFCASVNVSFVSNISGGTYQWQVDTGSGFVDIANGGVYGGATTATLTLINPPTSYASYKYRCVVDGTGIGAVNLYKVGANWTGASSTDWTDTGNWSCGIVPDQYTDMQVNKNVPNYPVLNAPVNIKSLLVQLGASVTIAAGGVLNVLGR